MNKNLFRYTEKCLYGFTLNCARIERLKKELALLRLRGDVNAQNYDIITSSCSGFVSDPVCTFFCTVENIERKITQLEQITMPVEKLITDLEQRQTHKNLISLKILELYYFKGLPVEVVMQEIHSSRSSFFERKYALVKKSMRYFKF